MYNLNVFETIDVVSMLDDLARLSIAGARGALRDFETYDAEVLGASSALERAVIGIDNDDDDNDLDDAVRAIDAIRDAKRYRADARTRLDVASANAARFVDALGGFVVLDSSDVDGLDSLEAALIDATRPIENGRDLIDVPGTTGAREPHIVVSGLDID
jgi:hypothetical protein